MANLWTANYQISGTSLSSLRETDENRPVFHRWDHGHKYLKSPERAIESNDSASCFCRPWRDLIPHPDNPSDESLGYGLPPFGLKTAFRNARNTLAASSVQYQFH